MKAISKFNPLFGGLLSGISFCFVLSAVLGVVYFFTPIRENVLPLVSLLIIVLSTFWGGKTTSSMVGSKGLFWGIGLGISIFFIIFIITIILGENLDFISITEKFLFCIIGGSLGGIFGISK